MLPWFPLGVIGAHVVPAVVPQGTLAGSALATLIAVGWRPTRALGWLGLGLVWAWWSIAEVASQRLPGALAGAETVVTGTVVGLPETRGTGVRFRLRLDAAQQDSELRRLPPTLLVRWYRDAPTLKAGCSWRLSVRLRPPRGRVNFAGQDRERWYFAERIGGLADVRTDVANAQLGCRQGWHRIRGWLRDHVSAALESHRAAGVIAALAVADRAGITEHQSELLRVTGTAHLLAISGLHIGLAATLGFLLGRLCSGLVQGVGGPGVVRWLPAAVGLAAAVTYAALTGWGVPARRALVMVGAGLMAVAARRSVPPWRAWWLALAAVLAIDPLAPLAAGTWLSFGAVAVLLATFTPRPDPLPRWRALPRAQWRLGLALMPLSLAWFGQASVLGLFANLVAVPWVSVVVVPLMFIGLLAASPWPLLSAWWLQRSADATALLLAVLDRAATLAGPLAQLQVQTAPVLLVLAAIAGIVWLAPVAHRWRFVALVPLVVVVLGRPPEVPAGATRLDLLDAGQGQAALLTTSELGLLYDTGPGAPATAPGGAWDLVNAVLRPAVSSAGHGPPEHVVASHADLDHAGGLPGLRAAWPQARFSASLPRAIPGIRPCIAGDRWQRPGAMAVQVLHPTPWLPYLGNDSSCVLSVTTPGARWLLPGDIGRTIEARLLTSGIVPHDVIVVAHHGSRSSSSKAFVERVRPRLALVAAGAGNRWGFPDPGVVASYRAQGARVWSTADCGALRLVVDASGGWRADSARRGRPAPWRWPAAPGCPQGETGRFDGAGSRHGAGGFGYHSGQSESKE